MGFATPYAVEERVSEVPQGVNADQLPGRGSRKLHSRPTHASFQVLGHIKKPRELTPVTENQQLAGSRCRPTYAVCAGTTSSILVPARGRLQTLSRAPIRAARSRMPGMPQWPLRPDRITSALMPDPSSRTQRRKRSDVYSSSNSTLLAWAWRMTFIRASRPDAVNFVADYGM